MISSRVFAFSLFSFSFLSIGTEAASTLVSRWAVDLLQGESPLERHQSAELSGITLSGNYFYIDNPAHRLDKRFLQTGEIEWTTPLEGASQSSWVVAKGEVFGGDTKGNLYCIRASDGAIKWKVTSKGVFFSKVLVTDDKVFVMTSLGSLQAYDLSTGQWLWQQTDPQAASLALWSAQGPVTFQGLILAGFPSALLQAFEAASGKLVWKESFAASPLEGQESFNDLKAVSTDGEVLVASSFGGELKAWRSQGVAKKLLFEKRTSLYAPATVGESGSLFLSARDGSVQRLELETGFVRWKKELSRGLGTSPSVSGNKVWVGSSAGDVLVFSKEGELLAKSDNFESSVWNPPVPVGENEALVLTSRGVLRRLKVLGSGI